MPSFSPRGTDKLQEIKNPWMIVYGRWTDAFPILFFSSSDGNSNSCFRSPVNPSRLHNPTRDKSFLPANAPGASSSYQVNDPPDKRKGENHLPALPPGKRSILPDLIQPAGRSGQKGSDGFTRLLLIKNAGHSTRQTSPRSFPIQEKHDRFTGTAHLSDHYRHHLPFIIGAVPTFIPPLKARKHGVPNFQRLMGKNGSLRTAPQRQTRAGRRLPAD